MKWWPQETVLRRRGARTAATVLTAFAMLASACGTDAGRTSNDTITLAIPADVTSLDPHSVGGYGAAVWPLLYDPLVHAGRDGRIQPGLAESWDVDETGGTFTIRDGVTCSDGTPFTASSAARNVTRLKRSDVPAAQIHLNTTDYTVSADDAERRLTLTLDSPNPFLLEGLSSIFMACGRGLDDSDAFERGSGTGPFRMTGSHPGDRYVFTARPEYAWGPGGATTAADGFPRNVTVRVVSDETTAANLLLAGDLDIATFAGPEHQRVQNARDITATRVKAANWLLVFNHNDGHATADRAVRRALAAAISRKEHMTVRTGGLGSPSTALATMAPALCGYDSASALPAFDVHTARRELDAAGWTPGPGGVRRKDGRELTLRLAGGTAHKSAFEHLQRSWGAIGVRTELRLSKRSAVQNTIFNGDDWDAVGVVLEGTSPMVFEPMLSGPPPKDGLNFAHVNNSTYTTLSAKAMSADRGSACGLWEDAERAVFSSADLVPLVQLVTLWAHRDDVSVQPRATVDYVATSLRKG